MSSKIIVARILILTVFLSASSSTEILTITSTFTILKVPDDYPTIQAAVDAASVGDVIRVAPGIYFENVHIPEGKNDLSLLGANRETTIIDGNMSGLTVWIDALNVELSGFTIQNGDQEGIWIQQLSKYGESCGCKIHDNILRNNKVAITLNAIGTIVERNVITDNLRGINVFYFENKILDNNITNNLHDLYLREGGNHIINNDIIGKLIISESHKNVLRNNEIQTMYVSGQDDLSDYIQDIDTSNTMKGKPIYYIINQTKLLVDANTYPDAGYLAFVNSDNILLRDLEPINYWLFLAYSTDCIINNSTFQDEDRVIFEYSKRNTVEKCVFLNLEVGLYLHHSTENRINKNAFYNCKNGINFYYSDDNEVINNTISNNKFGAFFSEGSGNVIIGNNFINNTSNIGARWVETEVRVQYWDDGFDRGNYWSDYTGDDLDGDGVGDTPYIIDEENRDSHPMMNPQNVIPIAPEEEIEEPEKGPEEAEEPLDGKPPIILMYEGIIGVAVAALIILFIRMRK